LDLYSYTINLIMENYDNVDNRILTEEGVKQSKQSPLVYIVIILAGVVLGFLSIKTLDNQNLAYGVAFVCAILVIIGLKGVFVPKKILKYAKTGDIIKKRELFYNIDQKTNVCDCVKNGVIDELLAIQQGDTGRIKVVFYSTPNHNYSLMQIFEYIPYEYVPISEVKRVER